MECAGSLIHQEQGHGVGFHPGSHADDPGGGLSEDRHRGRLSGRAITFTICSRCPRLSESSRRSQNPGPLPQVKAALSVNRELIQLYWEIGRSILAAQDREGWGTKVIDRLAGDLRHEVPEMKGFPPRNLKYMRRLAEAWPDPQLCNSLLHKFPGATTASYSIRSASRRCVSITSVKPSSTAGAGTSSSSRSRAGSMNARTWPS